MWHKQMSQWGIGWLKTGAIAVPLTLSVLALPALAQSTAPDAAEIEPDDTEIELEGVEIEPTGEMDVERDDAVDPAPDAVTETLPDEVLGEVLGETPAIVPSVTTILPADVAAVILLNTQEEQWQSLSQYQLIQLFEDSFGAAPSNPGSLSFVPYQVDYETAIAPWIGDYAATVVMPVQAGEERTITENSLMVAPIADADQLPVFLDAIRATRTESPTETTYRGIPILAWAETTPSLPEEWFEPVPPAPNSAPLPEVPPELKPSSNLPENTVPSLDSLNSSTDWEIADVDAVEPDTDQPLIIEVEVDGEVITVDTTESGSRVFELNLPNETETQIEGLEEFEPSAVEPPEIEPFEIEPFDPGSPDIETGDDFPVDESTLPSIPGLAIAVLPDFIALAASPEPIQQWLDSPITHEFGVDAILEPQAPVFVTPDPPTPDSLTPDSPTSDSPSPDFLTPDTLAPDPLLPDPLTPESPPPNSLTTETLATSDDFQRLLTDDKFERSLMVGYGNLDQLARFSGFGIETPPLPPGNPFPLPPGAVPPGEPIDPEASFFQSLELAATAIDTLESFVTLEPEGIQFQSRLHFRLPQLSYALLDDVDQIYDQIPAPTYFLASGQDLSQLWLTVSSVLEANPATAEYLDMARLGMQLATGLDLDEDLFRWMDGEYSVFLFPSRYSLLDDFLPNLDLGLGMMIQTRDRAAAETAVAALSNLAASALQLEVMPSQVNDQPITSLRLPSAVTVPPSLDPNLFSYGWVNDNTLVMTLGESQMSLLNPAPLDPISTAYPFAAVNQRLPHPNYGYAFLNTGATLSLVYQLLPPEWKTAEFREVQRFLGSIHSLSGTMSSSEDYLQADFLFGLSPARNQP